MVRFVDRRHEVVEVVGLQLLIGDLGVEFRLELRAVEPQGGDDVVEVGPSPVVGRQWLSVARGGFHRKRMPPS